VPISTQKTLEEGNAFYWPHTVEQGALTHFRIAGDTSASRRHIDEVCLEEISALVLQVLHQAGGAPRAEVARTVCRLVGMSAATAPAVARVVLAMDGLQMKSKITQADGSIRLAA
jgi:hypothetical protein